MSADRRRQVGHAGGVHLQVLAERAGLAGALTQAMRRPGFRPGHERGRVLVDLACAIVLGAVAIGDIAVLEHQREVMAGGPAVASPPTVWRVLDEVGELQVRRVARARATVRRQVWSWLENRPQGFPWIVVDGAALTGWTVIDSDATPVACASEKEGAAGTYKKGVYGLCPMIAFCDNTGEMLAQELRPGDAGCNSAEDNIACFAAAVEQLPAAYRRKILFRIDGAGFSHGLLTWIAKAGGRRHPSFTWQYSTGWAFTDREMTAVTALDELEKQERKQGRSVWQAALDADGAAREDAQVADITGLLGDLSLWPPGHRVIVRREPLHPRYVKDASPYELEHGMRLQTFATNTPDRQASWLDARHRTHARVEAKIRDSKDAGLNRFPSRHMKVNQAWLLATALACDLRNWLQLLGCEGEMAKATPKTLRFRFLHVPAVIVRGQRKRTLKIPRTWPWANAVVQAFRRLMALPYPT
ncbi:IS1380 family transposase [Streptacidiphilus sp. PAMC 29251]